MTTLERWHATWRSLGVSDGDDATYHDLVARYGEAHRHYHTMRHLEECFASWDAVRDEAERAEEVELALWFHDVVYDSRGDDNEARSAVRARAALAQAGAPPAVAARIEGLILATRHDMVPATPDAACLVDADLAILAATPERFDEYERQVRAEYAWVPAILFRRKRREVLVRFLERPAIYATRHFRQVGEAAARANLARSLARLEG